MNELMSFGKEKVARQSRTMRGCGRGKLPARGDGGPLEGGSDSSDKHWIVGLVKKQRRGEKRRRINGNGRDERSEVSTKSSLSGTQSGQQQVIGRMESDD